MALVIKEFGISWKGVIATDNYSDQNQSHGGGPHQGTEELRIGSSLSRRLKEASHGRWTIARSGRPCNALTRIRTHLAERQHLQTQRDMGGHGGESQKGGVDHGDEEQLREEIQKVSELGWLEGWVSSRMAGFWSDAVGEKVGWARGIRMGNIKV